MRQVDVINFSKFASFKQEDVENIIHTLDRLWQARDGILSIAIMDDDMLTKLHIDFLNDATKTDVITFDGQDDEFGEICVCAQRAFEEAENFSNNKDEELNLYITHGYLHLIGFDDLTDEDSAQMRIAEKKSLDFLKENKAIVSFF